MTPEHDDESFREAQEDLERRDPPCDDEEAAACKALGRVITIVREWHDLSCEEVAQIAEMTVAEFERIERGEIHARWGDLRRISKGLGIPLPTLFMYLQLEEHRIEHHLAETYGDDAEGRPGE